MTKDMPAGETALSHQLLVRAGLFRPASTSGLIAVLPAGLRVLEKLERVIASELEAAPLNAQRLSLPLIMSRDLWLKSGRWEDVKDEILSLQDRHGANLLLCPTHEEAITDLVTGVFGALSARLLPLNVYQIATKFRDERRPRGGLLRAREFLMKDMYTFHSSHEDALNTYQQACEAYMRIFNEKLGVKTLQVAADSGKMGGKHSHEFHIASSAGEDQILSCDKGRYLANVEKAQSKLLPQDSVADLHQVTLQGISIVLPKHRKMSLAKLAGYLSQANVEGPVDAIKANLVEAQAGDACIAGEQCNCGGEGRLVETRGIEVGHAFVLGTRYSLPLSANFVGADGKRSPLFMGCYGIGVSRMVAAVIEADGGHDRAGIIFPEAIAPFTAVLFSSPQGPASVLSECFAALNKALGGDLLLDDRENQSFGAKMAEAKLLGVPSIVVVSKTGALELHKRRGGSVEVFDDVNTLARRLTGGESK